MNSVRFVTHLFFDVRSVTAAPWRVVRKSAIARAVMRSCTAFTIATHFRHNPLQCRQPSDLHSFFIVLFFFHSPRAADVLGQHIASTSCCCVPGSLARGSDRGRWRAACESRVVCVCRRSLWSACVVGKARIVPSLAAAASSLATSLHSPSPSSLRSSLVAVTHSAFERDVGLHQRFSCFSCHRCCANKRAEPFCWSIRSVFVLVAEARSRNRLAPHTPL